MYQTKGLLYLSQTTTTDVAHELQQNRSLPAAFKEYCKVNPCLCNNCKKLTIEFSELYLQSNWVGHQRCIAISIKNQQENN